MQLIIESESISDIEMSTLDETQDKQNAVIADIKKDIQSIKEDVNKDGASGTEKQLITEAKTNGDIDSSNVNGTESPNNDKENDAPKMDMSLDAADEESIENITNCLNSFLEDNSSDKLSEKVNAEETPKVDNEIDSVHNDSAKESDTKMEIDDDGENNKPESPSAQIIDESNISKLEDAVKGETKEDSSSPPLITFNDNDDVKGDTCQDSVESAQISELPIEIETPEKLEVDPNTTVESQPNVDDSASNFEDTNEIPAPENVSLNDIVNNDEDKVMLQGSPTNNDTCDVDNTKVQDEGTEDAAICQNDDENRTENTATSESDINNPNKTVSETDKKIELDNSSIHNKTVEDLLTEVKVASVSEEVVEKETAADVVSASEKDSYDYSEDKLSDKENHATEIVLDPCEKVNVGENETSHDDVAIINSGNGNSEEKLSDKENHSAEIVLDPCEKVNDGENETSHDDVAIINSSNDNSEDKLADNKIDFNDIDLVPCDSATENKISRKDTPVGNTNDITEDTLADNKNKGDDVDQVHSEKVVANVTEIKSSHKDTPIESTNDISEEIISDFKNDDNSKENLLENANQEKLLDNESEDVTDTTSIEHKESDSTDMRPKESETIENEVTKIPETGDKKEADSVSISSMEVDDVDIIPEKNDSASKEIEKKTIELLLGDNNVIEIIDQDLTEINTDKVDNLMKKETQDKKPDETIPSKEIKNKDEISDEDDIKIIEESKTEAKKEPEVKTESKPLVVCKLSNTLDILSDEEEEPTEPPLKKAKIEEKPQSAEDKQCINLDDDDDIVLIEDTKEPEKPVEPEKPAESEVKKPEAVEDEPCEKETKTDVEEPTPKDEKTDVPTTETDSTPQLSEKEPEPLKEEAVIEPKPKPLLPMNVLKSAKKNLSDMTRDELEEFCILKIVEGIVDRSSLSEIKKKMKAIEQNMEEYKKKALMLARQNRDLQLVVKTVQEEQKNRPSNAITPLKITRSVGMQVLMFEKTKKKPLGQLNNTNAPKPVNRTPSQTPRPQRPQANNQNIPVPKLIPASPAKIPSSPVVKPQTPNGIRSTPSPAQKNVEKRPLTRQSVANTSNAMTVDLTDDDPPAKVTKSSPVPPVRLVPSQNLMAPRPQTPGTNPRKVFIPINGPGQTVLLKNLSNPQQMGVRGRFPAVPRMPQNQVRMAKVGVNRHPAPLPDVMKQYQPPTWKALPPAPDLKLSKVENGIVISWKIEGYQEDSYEKIASYQLYAYQETSTPPSTALWKKIGDVKALPLPMACTLTQFMAGFKYYFAVRAVDVKSRLGPFSLPGSILLLNKM